MAYYTPDWIRKLVKQDHAAINAEVNKKGGDFRSYIDSVLPFTLYIDIAQIRKEILKKEAPFIQDLANLLQLKNPQQIITELDNAYQAVINDFINNKRLVTITDVELQQKFDRLNSVVASDGNIRQVLKQEFNKTLIVSNLSKLNTRVLIIYTNFANVSTSFGVLFKKLFNYNAFSDVIDDRLDNGKGAVPREIVRAFLNGNFGKLQNIGHIEVDILSSKSREVKRGLVTPRLLQALLSLPDKNQAQRITRNFSKETGQAETRLVIRKLFTKNKLVLEILVENAFLIGKVEAQQANSLKAGFEKAYQIGKNFTQFLQKNVKYLADLETSKTLNQYIADSVLTAMKGKTVKSYTSNTNIVEKTNISIKTVKVKLPKSTAGTSTLPILSKTTTPENSLTGLQFLINARLVEQVKQNMGSGNRTDILNLRTGRFAESVKVERLSVSRENMITAFYTYMRNPYATFSDGGRQQYPRSRDPKLLIAKSIREIAQEKVQNRLRAVLV